MVKPTSSSFYNSLSLPPKLAFCSSKASKVQESPLDARSPQEVLEKYGMYRDETYYGKHPEKLYLDLTEFDDFETTMNNLISVRDKFEKLPSSVRAEFNNDLNAFVSYCKSSDFNIERLMDDRIKKSYKKYQAEQQAKKDFEAYQNSSEYKKLQKEAMLRKQFEEEQFNSWLSTHNTSDLS